MKKSCIRYYGGKLLAFVVSVLVLSVLVFYIARLAPGDPLVSYYGDRVEKMSVAERAWAEEKLGLSDPIYVQYVRWLAGALHGEFGISYKYKMDVLEVIGSRVGNTLILGGIGFVLIFTLAMALGVLCAWKEERPVDRILCKVGTVTSCIPEFWLSLVLILVFSVALRWLPSSGAYAVGGGGFGDRLRHLVLPMTVVVLRLHAAQQAARGGARGLCPACAGEGAFAAHDPAASLSAECVAVVSEPDGHLRAAHPRRHLCCRDGVFLSRHRHARL